MCEKMILAILVVAVALGAETELKTGVVLLCSAADCAFMPGNTGRSHLDTSLEVVTSLDFAGL